MTRRLLLSLLYLTTLSCGGEVADTCAERLVMRDYYSVEGMVQGGRGPVIQTNVRIYELDFENDEEVWSSTLHSSGTGTGLVKLDSGEYLAESDCTDGPGHAACATYLDRDGRIDREVALTNGESAQQRPDFVANRAGKFFVWGGDPDTYWRGIADETNGLAWAPSPNESVRAAVATQKADEFIFAYTRYLDGGINSELYLQRVGTSGVI